MTQDLPGAQVAASNAISALCAGLHGSALVVVAPHLDGIAIPYANLSGANLSGCSLTNADLRHSRLDRTCLDGTDISRSLCEGLSFSMMPLFLGHTDPVCSVSWSPDGTRIASGSVDESVRVWDAATGQCVSILNGHSNYVSSVSWSPDGTRIASGSYDNSVRVWDAATGQCVSTLNGHSDWVNSVSWSPDGTRIASGSYDKSVRVWDAATGALLGSKRPAWASSGTRSSVNPRDESKWTACAGTAVQLTGEHRQCVMWRGMGSAWVLEGRGVMFDDCVWLSEANALCLQQLRDGLV
jgi:WD40 repeat protein